jgi:hypothetical protein
MANEQAVQGKPRRSASTRSVRLVPLQEAPPRLRLETLTAQQVEVVLGVTYAAVLVAAVLALVESQAYVYSDVSIAALPSWAPGCAAGPTVHTACLGDNSSWWADGREYLNATFTPLELSINYTNRFFKLHANLSTRTFDGRINETFSAPVQMVGNVTAYSSKLRRWVHVVNVSTLHWLHCYQGRVGCEPLTLYELDVIDYTHYSLNLTFNNSNLPELARDKNLTMAFVFSFLNPDFAVGQLVARATLCAITVMVIVLYSIALCAAHVRPLPEQQWIRCALVLVVLFQDPGLFLHIVMGGSTASPSSALGAIAAPSWLTNDVQSVYLVGLFLHYFAVLGLFLFWAMMLHSVGLPAPGDEARMLQEKLDRDRAALVIAATTHARSGSSLRDLASAASDSTTLEVPLLSRAPVASLSSNGPAGTNSSTPLEASRMQQAKGYPWSFYAPKLAVAVTMWVGLVASWAYFPTYSWAFATELRGTGADSEDDERALAALYMAFRICTGVYFCWYIIAFNRAYQRLRALPYLETRFRQLSFHFFVFHGTWVIAYITITYIWQTLRPASALSDEDGFSPDSKCLLCTVYLCVLAFVYSPAPKDAAFAGASRQFHVNKTAWLLEIAVHSYADSSHQPQTPDSPQVRRTPSGEPPGSRGELWELGLQHEAFLHDADTDTTVLVASEALALARARGRRRRLVVAFRGTKSRENFKTDFDFLPVTIDLKDTDKPLGADDFSRTSSADSRSSSDSNGDEGLHEEEDLLSVVGGAGRRCGGYGGCVCACFCCCCPAWLLPNIFGLDRLLKPRAHRGFWRAYRSVSPELRRQLRSIVSRMHEEGRQFAVAAEATAAVEGRAVPEDVADANWAAQGVELLVVGHSLGGALANICALDIGCTIFRHNTRSWQERLSRTISRSTEALGTTLREIGHGLHIMQPQPHELPPPARPVQPSDVELGLYTFGAPRVGNHRFGALLLRALGGLEQAWRVVCLRDLVVDVNPACLGASGVPLGAHYSPSICTRLH